MLEAVIARISAALTGLSEREAVSRSLEDGFPSVLCTDVVTA